MRSKPMARKARSTRSRRSFTGVTVGDGLSGDWLAVGAAFGVAAAGRAVAVGGAAGVAADERTVAVRGAFGVAVAGRAVAVGGAAGVAAASGRWRSAVRSVWRRRGGPWPSLARPTRVGVAGEGAPSTDRPRLRFRRRRPLPVPKQVPTARLSLPDYTRPVGDAGALERETAQRQLSVALRRYWGVSTCAGYTALARMMQRRMGHPREVPASLFDRGPDAAATALNAVQIGLEPRREAGPTNSTNECV